jgi:hypothetical protein
VAGFNSGESKYAGCRSTEDYEDFLAITGKYGGTFSCRSLEPLKAAEGTTF